MVQEHAQVLQAGQALHAEFVTAEVQTNNVHMAELRGAARFRTLETEFAAEETVAQLCTAATNESQENQAKLIVELEQAQSDVIRTMTAKQNESYWFRDERLRSERCHEELEDQIKERQNVEKAVQVCRRETAEVAFRLSEAENRSEHANADNFFPPTICLGLLDLVLSRLLLLLLLLLLRVGHFCSTRQPTSESKFGQQPSST